MENYILRRGIAFLLLSICLSCSEDPPKIIEKDTEITEEVVNEPQESQTTDVLALPLASFNDITDKFIGAFNTNVGSYGSGQIAYNPDNHSLFIAGHVHDFSIGEYAIPDLVDNITDISALNSTVQLQANVSMRNKIPQGNWEDVNGDRVLGMLYHNGKLLVNGIRYYAEKSPETTIKIEDPNNLSGSDIVGSFNIAGGEHMTNWWFPVPEEWQTSLNGSTHLTGSGMILPIVSRLSIGPTLFGVDIDEILEASPGETVESIPFMDFSLERRIVDDFYNVGGATGGTNNDVHTFESKPYFGFIVPGTRTYAILGFSGGHTPTGDENPYAGIMQGGETFGTIYYKDTEEPLEPRPNSIGVTTDGYSIYNAQDMGPRYWLFDMNDILNAANPHDILPYESQYFAEVFPQTEAQRQIPSGSLNSPRSGTWDIANNRLYLSWPFAGSQDGYEVSPVITVYQF